MIIKVLAFFLCASLGTELCAGTIALKKRSIQNRHEMEVAVLRAGHYMHDANGNPVPITTERGPPIDPNGKVIFKLYTKQTRTRPEEIKIDHPITLENGGYNPWKKTYMITHGWLGSGNSPSCVLIRDAYLKHTDANVFVIDWSSHAMSLHYIDVSNEVKGVAMVVQQFIKWLYVNDLNGDDVTLVGHSLGAHVMGLAGYGLTPKINYIVGLDPALPMFNFAGAADAISWQDANHVQLIHTNAGYLGYMCPHGHSDFYVNDGTNQPGCCDFASFSCLECSHSRSVELFAESISTTFIGTECANFLLFETKLCGSKPKTARMGGLHLQPETSGTYYLWTNSQKPFSDISKPAVSRFFALLETPNVDQTCTFITH